MFKKIIKLNSFIQLLLLLLIFLTIILIDHIRPKLEIPNKMIVNMSDKYIEPSFKATFLNHDLNDLVIKKGNVNLKSSGTYKIKYELSYLKRKTKKTLTVIVKDDIKPVITLTGDEITYLNIGDEYKEQGYRAIDNNDGDITDKVKIKGKVNTKKAGTYKLEYEVSDAEKNKAISTRIIRVINKQSNKTIYLTFDDGPSPITTKILDILKKENIKATFFVVKKTSEFDDTIRRINDEGHTIALHSGTHIYDYIYSSDENYFNDLTDVYNYVYNLTNVKANIIRFPGGSSNTVSKFNPQIMTRLTKEVRKRGYEYFDWNIDSGDTGRIGSDAIVQNVTSNLGDYHTYVVLMHDYGLNEQTALALEKIIEYGKNNNYQFDKISLSTPVVHHGINN